MDLIAGFGVSLQKGLGFMMPAPSFDEIEKFYQSHHCTYDYQASARGPSCVHFSSTMETPENQRRICLI